MSKKTGVIDEPVNYLKEENDKLGINDYAKALTNFIENNIPAVFYSLEMSSRSVMYRLISILSKV